MDTTRLPRRTLPEMAKVRQRLAPDGIGDVRETTRVRLLDAGLRNRVVQGARIAITAGSRGIGGFVEILAGIVDAVREVGGEPFLIPAMGSHGGASPEGQTAILNALGVTEASVGAPIQATMDTVDLGAAESGAHAHLDRLVDEADGVIVMGRVKTHPERFEGLASGLLKMVTIGLGKQTGAQEAHSHGLWESIESVPKLTMARAKIVAGVAVVENAFRQPVAIEAVAPTYDAFREADERLLGLAKRHFARVPFDELDVLVVDEMGKTISGTGMDTNVIGHWRMKGGEKKPDYRRIVPLSLTHGSLGNAIGLGLADFTTERLAKAYDPFPTYMNVLTATEPGSMNPMEAGLPLALSSDRDAIEVALYSALAPSEPRVCRIRSTAELDHFWVSPALLPQVEAHPDLTIEEPPVPWPFDEHGNLF